MAVKNVGAGHNLPTGVSDQKHIWLEVKVLDSGGETVYHSGAFDADNGRIAPDAVVWAERFWDDKGNRIMDHLTFNTARIDFTRPLIPPRGEDVVDYEVSLPVNAKGPFRVQARLWYRVAFQILPGILDELLMLAGAGDYPAAELKRLDAYAFFDPDIEQRLFPRAPGLSLELESRFWEGSAEHPGLQRLLETRAPTGLLSAEVAQTKAQLEQAREILDTKLGATAAFVQSLTIVLREGLEAILVIAILLGTLRAMGTRGYTGYIWGGVSLGIAASFATWYAASHLIEISTLNRELLEGITALLAAAVLVYVIHWIFHKTYVV